MSIFSLSSHHLLEFLVCVVNSLLLITTYPLLRVVSSCWVGDSWSHSCTNRVILYWNGNERYAYIDKSPSLRSASACYSVTSKGIRNSASNCKRIKMMWDLNRVKCNLKLQHQNHRKCCLNILMLDHLVSVWFGLV